VQLLSVVYIRFVIAHLRLEIKTVLTFKNRASYI